MHVMLSTPTKPYWFDLVDGVRIQIRPVTRIIQAAARAYAERKMEELKDGTLAAEALGAAFDDMPDLDDPDVFIAVRELLYGQGLAKKIVLDWEGVVDETETPVEPTPENIDRFMRSPYAGDLFVGRVQQELNKIMVDGKNSAPSPNGTSAGEANTANAAISTTSPVVAGTGEPPANAAPTGNTAPARKKDKPSGPSSKTPRRKSVPSG